MLKEADLADCVLESVKAHVAAIVSLDSVLAGSDRQRTAQALAKQYDTQIADNERQLEKVAGFKSKLYENMVSGIITKEEFKTLKTKYTADEERLQLAVESLQEERADALAGKAERLLWMEHFKRFEGLTELERRTVVNLIQSVRVMSKTELQIAFNYHVEYAEALSLLRKEAA
jgi:ribosomal protein S17E